MSTEVTKFKETRDWLKSMTPVIADALPRVGWTAENFVKAYMGTIYKSPALMDCSKASLVRCIVECATLGLQFNSLGWAYIVPYGKEATLIVGYKGLMVLALRSGRVASISARPVYDGDEFDYWYDAEADHLRHKPMGEPAADKLTHAYCIIRLEGGGKQVEVLTRKQIDAVRLKSPGRHKGPWVEHFAAMAVKTAIRRALKYAPSAIDAKLERAIEIDDAELPKLGDGVVPEGVFDAEMLDDDPNPAAQTRKSRTETALESLERQGVVGE